MPPCKNGRLRCRKCGVLPPKSIYAVEMRLKQILEAVAERIRCPEAHRNVQRNWISEGAHRTFGSYIFDRAASQLASKAGRLASHLRRSIKPRIKQRNLPVRPLADIPWDLGDVAEEIAADVVLVKLRAVHHASGAGNKIQGAL